MAAGTAAVTAIASGCASAAKAPTPAAPSVKAVGLGSGADNPACRILSQLGAADVLHLPLPDTVKPGPAHELHDEQACFLGSTVTVYLTEDPVTGDSCFGSAESVRIAGHPACVEYDPTKQVMVSIADGKYTDVEVVLDGVVQDRSALKSTLTELGSRAANLAR